MYRHACRLLWWEVCNLSNSCTAHYLCGLDRLQRQMMLLGMGRRDILRHNSNSKITIWVHLYSTILMHFRERLAVPSHFGPDMLWRVSMKIIWLQDRFPPSLFKFYILCTLSRPRAFDLCIGLLSSNYTNRFLGQVFGKQLNHMSISAVITAHSKWLAKSQIFGKRLPTFQYFVWCTLFCNSCTGK